MGWVGGRAALRALISLSLALRARTSVMLLPAVAAAGVGEGVSSEEEEAAWSLVIGVGEVWSRTDMTGGGGEVRLLDGMNVWVVSLVVLVHVVGGGVPVCVCVCVCRWMERG